MCRALLLLAVIPVALIACGKKGPPLPPLHLVPAAVTEVNAKRMADEVRIEFLLPTKNMNGAGPIELDRVEIYAVTVAAGGTAPTDRELLTSDHVVGTLAVKPAPKEDESKVPPPNTPADTRPGPGDRTSFVEKLTPDTQKPFVSAAPARAPAPPAAPAAQGAGGAKPPVAPEPVLPRDVRIYLLRGMTKDGRPGQATARLQMPLVPAPAPPLNVASSFDANAIKVTWMPAVLAAGAAVPAFNVYVPGTTTPLNAAPIAGASFEQPFAEFGKEQCFTVRAVETIEAIPIEGPASDRTCATPKDIFPPSPPKGLGAVVSAGSINLIWDASPEADVAGYVVLRGEAPGDTLQPITPEPIQDTKFTDTTVTPGTRYVYAVVAVDKATPPNRSAPSARVEETAG